MAQIHHVGFGALGDAAADDLVARLRSRGLMMGTVVELGCGSGRSAARLVAAGYDVVGFDLSQDLIALARVAVPEARFQAVSLVDADLPPCVAVAAFGEVLNYVADRRAGREALSALFTRVHAALAPGGVLLFDVAAPGREPAGTRRTWHEGNDWLLCLDAAEDTAAQTLTRRMVMFRRAAGAWERSDETHVLQLLERRDVLAQLRAAGFDAVAGDHYAGLTLPRSLIVFAAHRM